MDEEINKIKKDLKNVDSGILMLLINKKYERVLDKIIQLIMSSIYNLNRENMRIVELVEKEKHKNKEKEDQVVGGYNESFNSRR